MARTVEITFRESSRIHVHRVRNFAEERSLALGTLGELPLDQADTATTKVVVSKVHKRDVGRCKQLVGRLLKKHLLMGEVTISAN